MTLLIFAFISGLFTIAAPCIWPLLPIVLASSTGSKLRSLGITLGIILSFAFFTLSLSYILRLIPFDPNWLRYFAVAVITILGLSLIIPKLSEVLESWVSRLSGKLGVSGGKGRGFGGGFVLGLALGVVWSPCAGPILATVAALSITQAVSTTLVAVTISYCLGIGIPLLLFSLLGSHIFNNVRFISKYTERLQRIFGVIMIATALLILTNYDKVLEAKLLNAFPAISSLTTSFETSDSVKQGLDTLKQPGLSLNGAPQTLSQGLDNLGAAPDFTGVTKWLNTSSPLSLKDLRGKVVLVDFWTYTCINCIRTLPHLTAWYDKYSPQGFVIVGVHTPEFEFEKDTNNVLSAIRQYNIHYPVAQDNNYATWNAYSNQYWPAEYLIDIHGNIRRVHFGEGEYDQTEQAIQELLKEAGSKVEQPMVDIPDTTPKTQLSPESYLGTKRMAYLYPNGSTGNGSQNFNLAQNLPLNSFSFGGNWIVSPEQSQAGSGAVLDYHFFASKVFLVMAPPKNGSGQVKVVMDGKVVQTMTIDSDKLYQLVDLKDPGDHLLHLEFLTPGIQVFAFTFG